MKYNITDLCLIDAIDKAIKIYGLEGTEEKIKQLYSHPNMKTLRNSMLKELYRRYNE